MDLTPVWSKDVNVINKYGTNGITINNILWTENILLSANILESWHSDQGIFNLASYVRITELRDQNMLTENELILLIGTGMNMMMLPEDFQIELMKYNIFAESMSTAAACRTYNILVGEQRSIVAVLVNDAV